MRDMKAQVLGPSFPKEAKFTRADKLPKAFEKYIGDWRKNHIRSKLTGSILPYNLASAPNIPEESPMGLLDGVEAVKCALTCTALHWSQRSKSTNECNLRIILAGCCIQLDTVWSSRASWLGEATIVHLRQEFQQLVCRFPGMEKWEFWDGMVDIDVEIKRDLVTGDVIEEEVDMTGINLEGLSDGEVSRIRHQVASAAKAKDASKALVQADIGASQAEVAKHIWTLIKAPGVGTINIGTEAAPAWVMTPQIKESFEVAIQVSG